MTGVKISDDFGIIVKRTSIEARNLTRNQLFKIMEVERPFDEDENLLSFGPHFGEEAAKEFINRLETSGLVYYEDFFDFSDTIPQWCQLYAISNK